MNAEQLRDVLLKEIAGRFYSGVDAKTWGEDRGMLLQAITFPARWLNERGATLPGVRYQQILMAILSDTARHMEAKKFRRRAAYLLHCVQAHMAHQGDRYYQEAKGSKAVGGVAARAVSRLRIDSGDRAVQALAETHRVLCARKAPKTARRETQQELF